MIAIATAATGDRVAGAHQRRDLAHDPGHAAGILAPVHHSPYLALGVRADRRAGVVNWALGVACVALVLGFRSSSALAAAYGIAVTGTM